MILPTKHITLKNSILGAGATVLRHLDNPHTVTSLWERVRHYPETGVYNRFVLVLDFLFTIGVLDIVDGLLVRRRG
jgi:hypothetical protein